MTLADRLEQGGIVVASAVVLALPTATLIDVVVADPTRLQFLAVCFLPGLLVGLALVFADGVPLEYGHVWRFGVTSWLAFLAIASVSGEAAPTTELVAFGLAVAIGLLVAAADRWLPRLRQAAE